jgi:radical SAM superfamily enzyme YgiQ (UPF0313 family)
MLNVVFNCMPPADLRQPSAPLHYLQHYLQENGVDASLEYWNQELAPLLANLPQGDQYERMLLPFCIHLNQNYNDSESDLNAENWVRAKSPLLTGNQDVDFESMKGELIEKIDGCFDRILGRYDPQEHYLFCFTAKFYQWLPALVLIRKVRETLPNSTVVMGGFDHKSIARISLERFQDLDFTIWGEGEIPLLRLYQYLAGDKSDVAEIPRLAYRDSNEVKRTYSNENSFAVIDKVQDLNFSAFLKYEDKIKENGLAFFPLSTIRGCRWNRCRFCVLNMGYQYREKKPEQITREIDRLLSEYKITSIGFCDNDLVGSSRERFDQLLDQLIDLQQRREEEFQLFAEIMHDCFEERLVQKMALAGFIDVQIGFEALSNDLLQKMNKKTRLVDNILFVRLALKYGISLGVNLITGIPGESIANINESLQNLYYLRFFLGSPLFSVDLVPLHLYFNSYYYRKASEEERQLYNESYLYDMVPKGIIPEEYRLHFFGFKKKGAIDENWKKIEELKGFYENNTFRYGIDIVDEIWHYEEYCNDTLIKNIDLEPGVYQEALKFAAQSIGHFDDFLTYLEAEQYEFTKEEVREALYELAGEGLLYFDSQTETFTSVINVENKSTLYERPSNFKTNVQG